MLMMMVVSTFYLSPVQASIKGTCERIPFPCRGFKYIQVQEFLFSSSPILLKVKISIQFIINVVLSWTISKDKGRRLSMNNVLRWLHWWYDFT